ncbi:hypothetical protein [Sanguibacter sp. Z1732]|uniref:hypothetical protein n=1 Tax=Sanguibacter sp. Z1732 TaxID=3435412 RepID=UPI003D9CBBF5
MHGIVVVLPGERAVPIVDSTAALVQAVLLRFYQSGTPGSGASGPGTPGPPS